MSLPPLPVVFDPLFKAKPWGGRRLQHLFNKRLPDNEPIGESWELVSLPENESHVRSGPLAGTTLTELVARWGPDLLGDAPPFDGRFPLLIKFLDANQHLSVQVHPKPAPEDPHGWKSGIKHECWYVLHAEPDAKLFVGLRPGVTPEDVARVANTPEMVEVLHVWDGEPGQCYYLPSGTLHALGAGLVVAEVQTPSDVTYRAYDWNRVGLDGKPRKLHIHQSLANTRYDVTEDMILQPRRHVAGSVAQGTRIAACERFTMDVLRQTRGPSITLPSGQMRIWMILAGSGRFDRGGQTCHFSKGDVVLLPAACAGTHVQFDTDCQWIEVMIPPPTA